MSTSPTPQSTTLNDQPPVPAPWSSRPRMWLVAGGRTPDPEPGDEPTVRDTLMHIWAPDGLHLARNGDDGDTWRVIHSASDKHIPLVGWPIAGVPHKYAEVAAASLATSGIDWTRPARELVHDLGDLGRVADAAKTASTAAYDAAVQAGDLVDDSSQPYDLASRLTNGRTTAP